MLLFILSDVDVVKIPKERLLYVVDAHKNLKGTTVYTVTCSLGRIRFLCPESVTDFLRSNADLGYVE